jgi:hypothetical protein
MLKLFFYHKKLFFSQRGPCFIAWSMNCINWSETGHPTSPMQMIFFILLAIRHIFSSYALLPLYFFLLRLFSNFIFIFSLSFLILLISITFSPFHIFPKITLVNISQPGRGSYFPTYPCVCQRHNRKEYGYQWHNRDEYGYQWHNRNEYGYQWHNRNEYGYNDTTVMNMATNDTTGMNMATNDTTGMDMRTRYLSVAIQRLMWSIYWA